MNHMSAELRRKAGSLLRRAGRKLQTLAMHSSSFPRDLSALQGCPE